MTEQTIILPPSSGNGNGHGAHYRLTAMVPKRRFLSYLRERWWVVMICLVCSLGVVLVYETIRPPSYRSFAQLYVSSDAPASPLGFISEDSQNYFGTQIELLKSARLLSTVYADVGVTPGANSKSLVNLTVTQPLRTSLLNVQATGSDPELVQRFLQNLIIEYRTYKKETQRASSEDLLTSITEEVARRAASLAKEQQKWADFQQTNNVAVLEEDAKSAGMYLSDLNLQMAKLRLEKNVLSEVSDDGVAVVIPPGTNQMREASNRVAAAAVGTLTNSASIDDDAALKSARVELAVLLGDETENVRSIGADRFAKEVARLQHRIAILENDQRNRKVLELQDLEKRIAAILEAIPVWETKMLNINQRLAQAQQLKDNIARQQDFYNHLLGTMQNVDLNKNVQQERLSLLQPATPAVPENRSLPLRIVLAIVGGLGLSLGIVFVWHLLDDRLVSVRDIHDQFGETVLGLVPQIKVARAHPEKALLENNDPRTAYAESFRHLRSALMLSAPGDGAASQTLLFTSAMPDEGKTTVAVNLARVLARSGRRVALVDTDVRSGGQEKNHPEEPDAVGLINYLNGDTALEEIVKPSPIAGLTLISRGPRNGGTEGLFLRPQLDELLQHLRERNDFVILDGAPVLAADDAALLVPHADSVIVVTRPFHTRSRLIRRSLDMLYQRRARQVRFILNRARTEDLAGYRTDNGLLPSAKNGSVTAA